MNRELLKEHLVAYRKLLNQAGPEPESGQPSRFNLMDGEADDE